jgi:hypothetical protein
MRSLALLALLLCHSAPAADPWRPGERETWESAGFLDAHPDVKHRKLGFWQIELGHPKVAVQEFLRAAEYSDKASQAMLGEMFWQGRDVGQDRPRAYAWMDLAAERGYRPFVLERERYWHAMSEPERAAALQIGRELYAHFGDAVARPRLVRKLKRLKPKMLGALGLRPLKLLTEQGETKVSRLVYYDPKYWTPERYFEWTDAVWHEPPTGTVEIGPLRADDSH